MNSLDEASQRRILCRDYHYDYGWGDLDYIEQHSISFRIDRARKPLRSGMRKASLVVFSYDSTSMMESMAMNLPTLCFWDIKYWRWRDEAVSLLKRMTNVGIYHGSRNQIAEFVKQFHSDDDILDWWASPAVQSVRTLYCEQYANTRGDEYSFWAREFGIQLSENTYH